MASTAGSTTVADWLVSIGYEDATRHRVADLLKERQRAHRPG